MAVISLIISFFAIVLSIVSLYLSHKKNLFERKLSNAEKRSELLETLRITISKCEKIKEQFCDIPEEFPDMTHKIVEDRSASYEMLLSKLQRAYKTANDLEAETDAFKLELICSDVSHVFERLNKDMKDIPKQHKLFQDYYFVCEQLKKLL